MNKLDDDQEDGFSDINITPFVDVVLVLLVIFMVTAPMIIKESLKVNLPKSTSAESSENTQSFGVAITKEGQLFLEGKLITENDLLLQLSSLSKNTARFLISADVDSKHGDLIRVIDILRSQGHQFALQVEKVKVKQNNVSP